jgi:hypothetical protein
MAQIYQPLHRLSTRTIVRRDNRQQQQLQQKKNFWSFTNKIKKSLHTTCNRNIITYIYNIQ